MDASEIEIEKGVIDSPWQLYGLLINGGFMQERERAGGERE